MRHTVPIEDLLLFLRSNTVVLVHEVEERTLGFLEGRIGPGLEVAQVGEDAFFEFLRILDRAPKSLETKGQTSNDVGTGDVEKVVPALGEHGIAQQRSGQETDHSTQDTYSPVGSKNLRMYWSGVQSTGAEMRKYLTGRWCQRTADVSRWRRLTVIDLLKRYLGILRQALLGFV